MSHNSKSLNFTAGDFRQDPELLILDLVPTLRWRRSLPIGKAHLRRHRERRVRVVPTFLVGLNRHQIISEPHRIDELDDDIRPHAFDISIPPMFIGKGRRRPSRRMRLDFVRRPVHDVNPAAICFRRKPHPIVLIGVEDAPVMLFLDLVRTVSGVGSRLSQNCSTNRSRSSSFFSRRKALRSSSLAMYTTSLLNHRW